MGKIVRETLPNGRSYRTYDCEPASALDDTAAFVVPAGQLFFMGDHRDNSADSRISAEMGGIGFVPAEAVIGRVNTVVFSTRGEKGRAFKSVE